jgi:hypothetical protein
MDLVTWMPSSLTFGTQGGSDFKAEMLPCRQEMFVACRIHELLHLMP